MITVSFFLRKQEQSPLSFFLIFGMEVHFLTLSSHWFKPCNYNCVPTSHPSRKGPRIHDGRSCRLTVERTVAADELSRETLQTRHSLVIVVCMQVGPLWQSFSRLRLLLTRHCLEKLFSSLLLPSLTEPPELCSFASSGSSDTSLTHSAEARARKSDKEVQHVEKH
jgi:hypothetical protein